MPVEESMALGQRFFGNGYQEAMRGNIDVAHDDFVTTTMIMGVAFPKASIQ